MGNSSIVPAARQDWAVIKKMFAESFSDDIFFPLMKRRLDLAQKTALLPNPLPTLFAGRAYLLRGEKRAKGFILINETGKRQLHLNYMAVLPEFRGHGLGRELAGFALILAREKSADISLETQVDSPAMRLYTQLGFRIKNEIHIYGLAPTPSAPAERGTGPEMTVDREEKSLRQLLKEHVLGIKTLSLSYEVQAENPVVFHVCQPAAGGKAIVHCNNKSLPKEILCQILPSLAYRLNNTDGAFLVLSGSSRSPAELPFVGERMDYVRMTKAQSS